MALEWRVNRTVFLPEQVVHLRQVCFTPSRVFEPGTYIAGELPAIAFELGLVEALPPVRGNSAEIRPRNREDRE